LFFLLSLALVDPVFFRKTMRHADLCHAIRWIVATDPLMLAITPLKPDGPPPTLAHTGMPTPIQLTSDQVALIDPPTDGMP
jgi:hypothetical protein